MVAVCISISICSRYIYKVHTYIHICICMCIHNGHTGFRSDQKLKPLGPLRITIFGVYLNPATIKKARWLDSQWSKVVKKYIIICAIDFYYRFFLLLFVWLCPLRVRVDSFSSFDDFIFLSAKISNWRTRRRKSKSRTRSPEENDIPYVHVRTCTYTIRIWTLYMEK